MKKKLFVILGLLLFIVSTNVSSEELTSWEEWQQYSYLQKWVFIEGFLLGLEAVNIFEDQEEEELVSEAINKIKMLKTDLIEELDEYTTHGRLPLSFTILYLCVQYDRNLNRLLPCVRNRK